jgi:hypothetical protein
MEKEIDRMMRESLSLLEQSIREAPEQWLWVHNRWKLQSLNIIRRPFRHESIAIILPQERVKCLDILSHLSTFRAIYPQESLTLFIPRDLKREVTAKNIEIIPYSTLSDLLIPDYRFKLIFNFSGFEKVEPYFKKRSTFTVANMDQLKKHAKPHSPTLLSDLLKKAICHAP